jgi:HTH-type transcriptional regulator/antitoxin HigA
MSLRFDRVDSFWHTLFHEFSHIRNKDGLSVDSDVNSHDEPPLIVKSPVERRADEEAAASLIPSDEMKSFILRVGPLYSKERIIQFAHKVKVHPGIIVGQLQHRGEIGYSANRGMLAKIRNTLIDASVTDGYGHSIDPRVLNDEH